VADHVVELERGRTASGPHVTPAARHGRGHDGRIVLRADGLSMSYDGIAALAGATLELREGELAVVVGRSGSGKSTLLMLLGGWQRPDAGSIAPALAGRWADLAYVPQRFGLLPELTVRENIELPARLADRADELRGHLD